jgi:tetratricopeptide (TPR) repeat protein
MHKLQMAALVSPFAVLLSVPASAQSPGDAPRTSFVRDEMRTPTQVSAANASPQDVQANEEQAGDLFMAKKQYREASETYRHLVMENPKNAVYMNKLGISLHQQTVLSEALKYYQKAVKLDPHYADAQNNIGTIWYQRKRYGKAIRAYLKAIKMRDDLPVLYSNLGYAYFSDGKYQEAMQAFRTALAKDPQFFERGSSRTGSVLQDRSVTDRGRFYFLLAKSFAEIGNYERCVFYLRKSKEEGYESLRDVKKDPAFAAVLKDPAVLDLLTPKPQEEPAQP